MVITPKMPLKSRNQGFTLVEIMVVLVILGILAGLAIPAYYSYIVRTNVSNMVAAAATVQTAVAETRQQYGNFDQIDTGDVEQTFETLGVEDPTLINPAISAVYFTVEDEDHMSIVLCGATAGQGSDSDADTVDIYLTATMYTGGLKWGCMYEGDNPSYVPASCRTTYTPGTFGSLNTTCPRIAPVPPI